MSELLNYLPLFLVLATLVTGALWGHDRFWRRPQRLAAAAALDERTPDAARGPGYEKARAALLADPPAMEWGGSFFPLLALVLVVRSFLFVEGESPVTCLIAVRTEPFRRVAFLGIGA